MTTKRTPLAKIPREIKRPCPGGCGCRTRVLNGLHFRELRLMSKLTLQDMGRICGVRASYLHKIEHAVFPPDKAAIYERLLLRSSKAGEE